MTEELKQKAEESAKKFFGKPTDLVDLDNLRIFKNGYLAGAEPREKRIEELENKLANVSYQLEGREVELKELQEKNERLKKANSEMLSFYENKLNENINLKKQNKEIEKRCNEFFFQVNEQVKQMEKELGKYTCTSRHFVTDDIGIVRTCYDVQDCDKCAYRPEVTK